MSVIAIRPNSDLASPAPSGPRYLPVIVGTFLFLFLAFTTATVFVSDAWASQSFQIGIFALLAVYLLIGIRRGREVMAGGVVPCLIYLTPLWGVVQLLGHTTSSTFDTRGEVLRWGALAGVFFLSQTLTRTRAARRIFLSVMLCMATAMAVLCIAQLYTSEGRLLWIIPTGFPGLYGTFPYHCHYAEFVEIFLPIALWRAVRDGWRSWWYGLAGGILYASVIGSASRLGALLCTAELLFMLVMGFVKVRHSNTRLPSRATIAILLVVPVLAVVFTMAVGWQRVWQSFKQKDQLGARREFFISALDMAKHRPFFGNGLGTFPQVYQRFAVQDFPFIANHAHNDWAEFAADGGIPFMLLILIPCAVAVPTAIRHPWGVGLVAIMIHACGDFPFPRPAVSGWIFALLGALYMARRDDRSSIRAAVPITDSPAAG